MQAARSVEDSLHGGGKVLELLPYGEDLTQLHYTDSARAANGVVNSALSREYHGSEGLAG